MTLSKAVRRRPDSYGRCRQDPLFEEMSGWRFGVDREVGALLALAEAVRAKTIRFLKDATDAELTWSTARFVEPRALACRPLALVAGPLVH